MSAIKEKYPFLINYFEKSFNSDKKNIAHCLLFYGSDLESQYELSLNIARMLNCKGSHDDDCNCLNCNWIRENKHPAVMTISKLDNKPSDDTSKTVVSIGQARMIKQILNVTSDYHRVLIFCDRDEEGKIYGLNRINFQEEASNALLKTFEEPPENTTFIFLTKNKTDIIDTVISRAQCFYVPSLLEESRDVSLVKDFMQDYFNIEREDVLDFNDRLNSVLSDNEPEEVFLQMQNYLNVLIRENIGNKLLKTKLIKDFKAVEKAKTEYKLNMNIQTIAENLAFEMILEQ